MKKFFSNLIYLSLVMVAFTFTACQEEFEKVGGEEEETLEVGSETASLIVNTSAKDGSFDNIVDEASCFAIQFPYTVEIADIQITIDSVEDLRTIEEIFDEVDTDDDLLDIIFPITIVFADYSELVIESKEQLRELAAECIEGGGDDDIECIDFVYPITLFTFDVNQQQTGSVEINSDEEMRRFFNDRNENELISIDFPVTLKKYDGTEVVVNSNGELARALEQAKDECDEDDDDDYNDDDFDEERFVSYLAECPWKLWDIKRYGADQIGQYEGFLFNFGEDGMVQVTGPAGNTTNSEWTYEFTENGVVVELVFDDYVDFSATWTVYEIEEGKIKFYSDSDNRIILKQKCDGDPDPTDCNLDEVAERLGMCKWRIIEASEDFYFEGLIDFSNNNVHAYFDNGAIADEGNWEVTETGLRFNALFSEIEGLSGDWSVVDCKEDQIKVVNDENRYYILKKDCESILPTLETLRNILAECDWVIKKVIAQGSEIDRLLGYEFAFLPDGIATLSQGESVSEGTWEVGYRNNQELYLMMSFGDEPDVSFEWPLRELFNDRIKLEIEEIDYELVLQRVCNDNSGDYEVMEARNIMMGGAWNVALYENAEVNATAEFTLYDFYFNQMNDIQVDENDNTITNGLWRVLRNHDEELKLYMNYGEMAPFDDLTNDWKVDSISTERIELLHITDDEMTEVLVFEKAL